VAERVATITNSNPDKHSAFDDGQEWLYVPLLNYAEGSPEPQLEMMCQITPELDPL
jgi:hypothetical protein